MRLKKAMLIILAILSIVLIDTAQSKIFNNKPVISF